MTGTRKTPFKDKKKKKKAHFKINVWMGIFSTNLMGAFHCIIINSPKIIQNLRWQFK